MPGRWEAFNVNVLRLLFLTFVILFVSVRTGLRRLLRGPKHPAWSYFSELWFEGTRAVFSSSHAYLSFEFQRRGLSPRIPRKLGLHVRHERFEIAGRRAELHTPRVLSQDATTVLYLHGGGYIMCSPGTHREMLARLSAVSGARVVVPTYRLAPEHPYPAAIEDCVGVYEALLADGVRPERLLLGGDSAGGGLVLAVLQRLRESGLPMPCGALLLSPWVDPASEGGTLEQNTAYDYLMPSMLAMASTMYVGAGDLKHPEICPLHADLSGFPPLLVHAGDAEIFHSQIDDFVQRASAAGVDVNYEVFPGMVHVFQMFGFLPQARSAMRHIGAFVKRCSGAPERAEVEAAESLQLSAGEA